MFISVVDLEKFLIPNLPKETPLIRIMRRWYKCFLMNKFDMERTGPQFKIKLLNGKAYKVYVPRRSPAAFAVIWEEVEKKKQAYHIIKKTALALLQFFASIIPMRV